MQIGTLEDLDLSQEVACDTETTGLSPYGSQLQLGYFPSRPFCFTFTDVHMVSCAFLMPVEPFSRRVLYNHYPTYLEALQGFYEAHTTKVFHNAGFDVLMLNSMGIQVNGEVHDTRILSPLVRSDRQTYSLKPLCQQMFRFGVEDEDALHASTITARKAAKKAGWPISAKKPSHGQPQGDPEADYFLGDPELVLRYAIKDTERTMRLWLSLKEMLTL